MKKVLIAISVIVLIIIAGLIFMINSCDQKHKRKQDYYNPPPVNEEVSSSSAKETLSSGVVIGVNCTNKVGGVNDETFDSFLNCVDRAVEEKGFNFSLKDKLHLDDNKNDG